MRSSFTPAELRRIEAFAARAGISVAEALAFAFSYACRNGGSIAGLAAEYRSATRSYVGG